MYEALVLQLGTFFRYKMFSHRSLSSGEIIRCCLYRTKGAITTNLPQTLYLLLPHGISYSNVPRDILSQLNLDNITYRNKSYVVESIDEDEPE